MINEFDTKIVDIIDETHDTKTFRIDTSKNDFSFDPGQFVNLTIDVPQNGEVKPLVRQYSISSSPLKKDYIDLTIKRMGNGLMSNYLMDNAKVNDVIRIKGPFGIFTFKDDVKKAVFIAGGSGISSLMAMMRYIADKGLDVEVTLLNSNKTPEDIIFRKDLEELKEIGFNIINTLTRHDDNDWDGEKGRMDKEMIRKYCDLDSNFYICGLPQMVDSVRKELEELSVEKSRIKFEKY